MENSGPAAATSDLLAELVKAIKSSRTAPEQVDLPIFRPNLTDASKWLTEINIIKNEFEWTDQQVIVRLGRFLTGISKVWFDNWSPDVKTWEVFQRDFSEAFPPKKILGQLLLEAAVFNSDRCNTYEAYVFEKVNLLRNLRVQWEEVDLVEITIHGIRERDIRTSASNQNYKNISELIVYLGSVPKRQSEECKSERKFTEGKEPPRKRFRAESREVDQRRNRPLRCYNCGKDGHIQRFCIENRPEWTPKTTVATNRSKPSTSTITCSFCAKIGHESNDCFLRKSIDKRKNVNFCNSGKQITHSVVIVDGIQMTGIVDTGADISLMAQKHVDKFRNKIKHSYTTITGLLPGNYVSNQSFVSCVDMSGVRTDLTFIIVPDSFLEYDLLVGCNLYDDPDIATITDHTGTKIVRNKVARVLNTLPASLDFDIDVPNIYKPKLLEVLSRYNNIIATSGNAVSCVNNTTMHIRLKDEFVVNRNPYRLSINERQIVHDIVKDLLANNIIQESESPFASPIILVKKKEGSYRLCCDYRELNSHTIRDRYPLPLVEDQLDRLGKGKIFTSVDMSSGFHQIPIDPESVHKTAFITPDGHFEYLRMPFGLANAPAVFQRAINKALGDLKNTVALVYLDDDLIPSESFEENLASLELVLQALEKAGFSLNLKKCHFFKDRLEYLGREISGEGIRPGMRKVEALVRSPTPSTIKQVRQLMGLAGYFRKFIPEFATRTACITKLTRSNEPFSWNEEQESARKYIIERLTSRPLLNVFDPELPTELHTDASCIGYGGVLLQKLDGNLRVIGYYSKNTNKYEEKYHSYELETLAVVNSMKHFRVYLLGIHFTLVTDCNAIKSTATKKDILPRVARWWAYMQDFTFDIVYKKGSSLPHVDFLSRNPAVIRRLTAHDNWLYVEQRGNNEVKKLINEWKEGSLDKTRYTVKNNILHYIIPTANGPIAKPFVPRHSRLGLLRIFHDEQCHVGIDKTLESIQRHFWFPRMRYFVAKYVQHCLVCAVKKTRSGPLQGFITNVEKPTEPMNVIHADCLGPLETTAEGYKHVLVLIDAFTKYCVLLPLKTVKAEETRVAFQLFISLFGTPKQIIMDAGKNFKNLSLPEYLDSVGINYHYTTPDVHRSNGQVERYMRTIMNLLRIETKVKSEWASALWKIQLVLNTTVQKSIKTTPLKALIGVEGSTPLIQSILTNISTDLQPIRNLQLDRKRIQTNLSTSVQNNIKGNEKRRNNKNFKVGDFVLMHRDDRMHQGKLKYEFQGPFEIISITSEGRYEIRRVGKSLLTKAAKEQLRMWPSDWSMTTNMEELFELIEDR